MDDDALALLVADAGLPPGWRYRLLDRRTVRIELVDPPIDNRHDDGRRLDWFGGDVFVDPSWDEDEVAVTLFVTLQFLRDHELREEFTIGGVRRFETHDPPLTGYQKAWWVEHRSALRGY